MTREEYITEQTDSDHMDCSCADCITDARERIGDHWDAAVAAERERCIRIVDEVTETPGIGGYDEADIIWQRIRSGE